MTLIYKIGKSIVHRTRQLRHDNGGTIIIEFAFCLPIFTLLGFTGVETANYHVANMRVSQIAMTVADNISRAKQSVPSALPQLREVDVNDTFLGARIQGGTNIPILTKGRIIVSSLQQNSSGKQTILWQRCKGVLPVVSRYGAEGATQPNTGTTGFQGMGTGATRIQAVPNSAVIFAEATYTYQPIVAASIIGPRTIRQESAFYVRDDRDLTQIHDPDPKPTKSLCSTYNSTF